VFKRLLPRLSERERETETDREIGRDRFIHRQAKREND